MWVCARVCECERDRERVETERGREECTVEGGIHALGDRRSVEELRKVGVAQTASKQRGNNLKSVQDFFLKQRL